MKSQEATSPDSHTVTEIHIRQCDFVRTSPHPEALIYLNITLESKYCYTTHMTTFPPAIQIFVCTEMWERELKGPHGQCFPRVTTSWEDARIQVYPKPLLEQLNPRQRIPNFMIYLMIYCWKDQKVKRADAGMEVIRLSWPLSYLLKIWSYPRHCTFILWYHTDPREVHFSQKREQYRHWTHCLNTLSVLLLEGRTINSIPHLNSCPLSLHHKMLIILAFQFKV